MVEPAEHPMDMDPQPETEPAAALTAPESLPRVETPAPAAAARVDKYSLKGNVAPDAEHKRKLQALELQRERILSEKTASAHRRQALAYALADIEEKLAELGWTIHL